MKKGGKTDDEGDVFDWQLALDDETLDLGGNAGRGEDVEFLDDFRQLVEDLRSEKGGKFLHGGKFEEREEGLFLAVERAGDEKVGKRYSRGRGELAARRRVWRSFVVSSERRRVAARKLKRSRWQRMRRTAGEESFVSVVSLVSLWLLLLSLSS